MNLNTIYPCLGMVGKGQEREIDSSGMDSFKEVKGVANPKGFISSFFDDQIPFPVSIKSFWIIKFPSAFQKLFR
jgi:hypothetical protein